MTKIVLFSNARLNSGFTLVELLVTLAVLATILAFAVPNLTRQIEASRVKSAAEETQSSLQEARSEAVKRNSDIYVRFRADGSSTWCYGASATSNCDCTVANSCALSIAGSPLERAVSSGQYPSVSLTTPANYESHFDKIRGITPSSGTLAFATGNFEMRLIINPLGLIRICSPAGDKKVIGYEDC